MQNKLIKRFQIIKQVATNNYNLMPTLVNLIKDKKVEVLEKQWLGFNSFKNKTLDQEYGFTLDLANIQTWITYDKCIRFSFEYVDNQEFICNVLVLDEARQRTLLDPERFSAKVSIPIKYLDWIEEIIIARHEYLAYQAYTAHLERQKDQWIKKYIADALR